MILLVEDDFFHCVRRTVEPARILVQAREGLAGLVDDHNFRGAKFDRHHDASADVRATELPGLSPERLTDDKVADGGWNCQAPPSRRSSFHTTICVLEGLLEYEKAKGPTTAVRDARLRGQEYLVERGMFKSLSTGKVIDLDWTLFSFPTYWHYDVLWGLDYLRRAGVEPDQRVAAAIDLVEKKRRSDGRWPLENPHPGQVHFDMEDGAGKASRWNTLRALRVLDWYRR